MKRKPKSDRFACWCLAHKPPVLFDVRDGWCPSCKVDMMLSLVDYMETLRKLQRIGGTAA